MASSGEVARVAVLVDCDNVQPEIVDSALRFGAQFGRVVVRRGYGNASTLAGKWREKLMEQAFTPYLQYQYAGGKNTADIALALDAMELLFDERVDVFCLVTSDSDFAYVCRKLRERGSLMCIVGEAKTPEALRNAADHFFEWLPASDSLPDAPAGHRPDTARSPHGKSAEVEPKATTAKRRPMSVVDAVTMLAGNSADGRVDLGALGNYLRRTDSSFTPKTYGHSGLLDMLRTYDLLRVGQAEGGGWWVSLAEPGER